MNRLTYIGNGFTRCVRSIYSRLQAFCSGFGKICTKTGFEDCINPTKSCFEGCIKGIKRCCNSCINRTKSSVSACYRPLKKVVASIILQIVHIADWNVIAQRLPLVHFFLLCIPLRLSGYIVAAFSLIHSILCFSLVMTMANYSDKYYEVYANKMDVFVCVVIYLSSTIPFMFTCIFLFVGTFLKSRVLVEIYLWTVVLHLFVNIIGTIGVSIYCIYNYQCFTGSGLGQSVIGLIFCFLYIMVWIYIISSLSSMMENPPTPPPLSK